MDEQTEALKQEPVAFVKGCNRGQWEIFPAKAHQIFGIEQPLYTTPPQPDQKIVGTVGDLFDERVISKRELDRDFLVYTTPPKENT